MITAIKTVNWYISTILSPRDCVNIEFSAAEILLPQLNIFLFIHYDSFHWVHLFYHVQASMTTSIRPV